MEFFITRMNIFVIVVSYWVVGGILKGLEQYGIRNILGTIR